MTLWVCITEYEKSQGILTLHLGGGVARRGRASEEKQAANTTADAITIRPNMQDSRLMDPAPTLKGGCILSKLSH